MPIKSFAPIAFARLRAERARRSIPTLPANSLGEFIALAKKQPGKLQYASGGVGSFMHLGGELFKLSAGVDLLHVPFRGGGPGDDRRDRRPHQRCVRHLPTACRM